MTENKSCINDIIKNITKARIAIIGLGISNRALINFLHGRGAYDITVYDKNESVNIKSFVAELMSDGFIKEAFLGEDYLDRLSGKNYNIIFRSPGIRHDISQLAWAQEHGAVISSEMELFFELCPCKIYGVTGSDGKTTTTTLLWRLLSEHYRNGPERVWLGGNIGTPLIDVIDDIKPYDSAVLELSSFQLMTMNRSPEVSIITNITPNHLDIHKSYDEYINAKKNIYTHQNENGVVVLNAKNEATARIAEELLSNGGNVRLFSAYISDETELKNIFGNCAGAAFEKDGELTWLSESYNYRLDRKSLLVPGKYNAENLLAAVSACADIITQQDIEAAVRDFRGVEHRCEFVRELRGIRFYNSSIDSSPNRTLNTLSVFSGNIIMIAGGKDKNIPYDAIGPAIAEKVKTLILTGPTACKIEAAVKSAANSTGGCREAVKIYHCNNYEEAVKCAYENASEGDTVLLSPASTSFDMFRNFEERGKKFKSLVMDLE